MFVLSQDGKICTDVTTIRLERVYRDEVQEQLEHLPYVYRIIADKCIIAEYSNYELAYAIFERLYNKLNPVKISDLEDEYINSKK